MHKFTGGFAAFLVGASLAAATAFGVVQSQQNAGVTPVDIAKISYGN